VQVYLLKAGGSIMSLISILVALVVAGVVLWLVNTYIPMDGKIKKILNVVVVVLVLIWLVNIFGLLDTRSSMHVGRMRMWW
jgi:hypothetical protein